MNINMKSNVIELTINDDPNRVIKFNPDDLNFVEKVYNLIDKFEHKEKEYVKRAEKIDAVLDVNTFGVPVNTKEKLAFLREICEELKADIDDIFGSGTSMAAFEDSLTLDMFEEFFTGVTPFIQQARSKKVQKYTDKKKTGGKAIMK